MYDVVLSVVEAQRVPCWVLMTVARIEELIGVATKVTKTFHLVLHSVTVNDVHNHCYAVLMRFVDKGFQFLRSSETTAGSEERTYVVAERAVVRMLLDSHNLDAVIAVGDDTRKYVVLELRICAHLLCIFAHSYVALIDEQRTLVRLESLFLPNVRLLGCPYLSRENLCVLVLNDTTNPRRDALALATVPLYVHLEEVAVLHCLLRQLQFPVACSFDTLSTIFLCLLPVVEVADKIDVCSIRCPLTENPSSARSLVKSVIVVTTGKVRQRDLTVLCQLVYLPHGVLVTSTNSIFKRLQPTVVLHKTDMFWCS